MKEILYLFINEFTNLFPFSDKLLHFLIGNNIYYISWLITKSNRISYFIVILIAFLKEIFDIIKSNNISIENLLDFMFSILI